MSLSRPVNIVTFQTEGSTLRRPWLDIEAVEAIINRIAQHIPIVVISLGGIARSGKSFLLNLFIHYLTHFEEHGSGDGWEDANSPVKGFNWAQSRTSVTRGMWMWDRPFIVKGESGSETAILLVDNQGTGDNRISDPSFDTQMMYISLQISSIQLINIEKRLSSIDLINLQLLGEFADSNDVRTSKEGSHLFESLAFVVRDFQDGSDFGEDPKAFEELREECRNAALSKVYQGIGNSFRNITTFNLPYPGEEIVGASAAKAVLRVNQPGPGGQEDGVSRDGSRDIYISKEFCDAVKEVIVKARGLAGWENREKLMITIRAMRSRLDSVGLLDIVSSTEAITDIVLNRAYSSALQTFKKEFDSLLRSEPLLSPDETSSALNSIKDRVIKEFQCAGQFSKYGSSILWTKYEGMLQGSIDSEYGHLKELHGMMIRSRKLVKDAMERANNSQENKRLADGFKSLKLRDAYKKTQTSFHQELLALTKGDGLDSIRSSEELKKVFGPIKQRAEENFEEKYRHGHTMEWKAFKDMLEELFDSTYICLEAQLNLVMKIKRTKEHSYQQLQALRAELEQKQHVLEEIGKTVEIHVRNNASAV